MRVELDITVRRPDGEVMQGLPITVNVRNTDGTAGALATIYAGPTGSSTHSNPLTTDSLGNLTGWVERGSYLLTWTGLGSPQPYEASSGAEEAAIEAAGPATLTYDGSGNLTAATTPSGTVDNITYDAEDRIHTIRDNGVTRTFTYDADGNLTAVS